MGSDVVVQLSRQGSRFYFSPHEMFDPDGQRGEFLHEEAAVAVRRVHRRRRVLTAARATDKSFLAHETRQRRDNCLAHDAARLAEERVVDVGCENGAVVQALGRAAGLEGVKLHLAKLLPAVVGASVDWLAGEDGLLPARASRQLVEDVMLEALVEADAEKPRLLKHFPRRAADHGVRVRVALVDELLQRPLGIDVEEWGGVLNLALHHAQGAVQHLQQLADGHAAVDALQVDDDVGAHALIRSAHDERHVLWPQHRADRSLLAVARRKLQNKMCGWIGQCVMLVIRRCRRKPQVLPLFMRKPRAW